MNAYKKNIYLDYLHNFTRNFNLSHGVLLIYLAIKGFTFLEIGIVESIFHVTSLTMEIPTGILADLLGRRLSRLLSVILYIAYLALLFFATDLFMVSIAFALCGLSYTLESGAGDALIYDSLIETKEESKYPRINSIKEIIYQSSSLLALLIGGYLASINYDWVFIGSMFFGFAALIFVYKMKDPILETDNAHKPFLVRVKEQYVNSIKYILTNKKLRFLVVMSSLFLFPVTVSFFYIQSLFTELGYSTTVIGIILALHSGFAILGALSVEKILKTFKERHILIMIPLIELILIWMLTLEYSYVPFIILGGVESMFYVIMLAYMNKIIPSNKRATILSMSNMVFSILMIAVFPVFGYIADIYSLKDGFIFNAIIVSVAYIIYIINYRKLDA